MLWVSGTELTRGMPSLNPEPCGRACLSCIWCTTDRVTWYTWRIQTASQLTWFHMVYMDLHATARRKRPAAPLVEYTGVVNMFEPSSEPCVNVIA